MTTALTPTRLTTEAEAEAAGINNNSHSDATTTMEYNDIIRDNTNNASHSNSNNNISGSHGLFLSTIEDSDEFSMGDFQSSRTDMDDNSQRRKRTSNDIEPVAATEDRAVSCLRIVVVAVLVLAGILVGVLVYLVAADSDQENFRRQYDTHANQILEAFNSNLNLKLGALESLGVSVSSYASDQQEFAAKNVVDGGATTAASDNAVPPYVDGQWPFVTVSDFAARAHTTRDLGRALFVGFCPVLQHDQLDAWEQYSRDMGTAWIGESMAYEQQFAADSVAESSSSATETVNPSSNGASDSNPSNPGRSLLRKRSSVRRNDVGTTTQQPSSRQIEQQSAGRPAGTTTPGKQYSSQRAPDAIATAAANKSAPRSLQSQQLDARPATIQEGQLNIPDYSKGYAGNVFRIVDFEVPLANGTTTQQILPQKVWKDPALDFYTPGWQHSKIVAGIINFDLYTHPPFQDSIRATVESKQAVLSRVTDLGSGSPLAQEFLKAWEDDAGVHSGDPYSVIAFPILKDAMAPPTASDNQIVAVLMVVMFWTSFMENVLSSDARGIFVVVQNGCAQQYTYSVTGADARFVGVGDRHDDDFRDMKRSVAVQSSRDGIELNPDFCPYTISVYPSNQTRDFYVTLEPIYYTVVCACVFTFTIVVFWIYDCLVERRQKLVLRTAIENRAIVASLFPAGIRDRLFQTALSNHSGAERPNTAAGMSSQNDNNNQTTNIDGTMNNAANNALNGNYGNNNNQTVAPGGGSHEIMNGRNGIIDNSDNKSTGLVQSTPARLKSYLNGDHDIFMKNNNNNRNDDRRPIADIYPHTTVYFADIAGFTRWSSQREPTEVFELLQTLYAAFDRIAKRLKVFKIETIGDCYVAVTGLPDPQLDHAVIMARFARECVHRMHSLVHGLVKTLGPDTAKLSLRVGVHSGPVTAGVLRGEKSRFQLFGDTVNTASRMESTGQSNHIQCSESTAKLLKAEGKGSWLKARTEKVFAKGKGELQTYWIKNRSRQRNGSNGSVASVNIGSETMHSESASIGMSEHTLGSHSPSLDTTKMKRQISSGETSVGSTSSSESRRFDSDPSFVPPQQPYLRKVASADSVASMASASAASASTSTSSLCHEEGHAQKQQNSKEQRAPEPTRVPSTVSSTTNRTDKCIEWAVDLLADLIKRVVFNRHINGTDSKLKQPIKWEGSPYLVVDEVAEIIHLPRDTKIQNNDLITTASTHKHDDNDDSIIDWDKAIETVVLSERVMIQLTDYVTKIASMYRDNPFHCIEHACHVAMSTHKLMLQINESYKAHHHQQEGSSNDLAYLGRISTNPVCHFALVLSALVHDVDHTGVSNMDLIRSRDEMAELYENRSIAEQNSMDIAWELLMDSTYAELQQVLCQSKKELSLLRQLTVNCIMATDIFDKDAKKFREKRWNHAFGSKSAQSRKEMSVDDFESLRATVILEHIIQTSDVVHTMQHYSVFRKWNERLFEEMLQAYGAKMSQKDPTGGWFESEVMFFDFYVVPLARKLLDCGAFGSSSDEFLQYALENRALWAVKGSEVVREMASRYHRGRILSTLIEGNRQARGPDDDDDDFTAGRSHGSSMAA